MWAPTGRRGRRRQRAGRLRLPRERDEKLESVMGRGETYETDVNFERTLFPSLSETDEHSSAIVQVSLHCGCHDTICTRWRMPEDSPLCLGEASWKCV
ncbi:hypothetical protein ALC57_05907 [Trachymyrmex cornetzi]|uniref:Uncharacterized protein n=1 Tax=Trachymyrmex cornetzi TaxID=471704 RepID=A0A151J9G2_9HYME|nr:hypothetical protein ALC57_05907 [Trachymyrmex cornetzi]